jgi:iron complex transport system substrate-binding protein
MKRLLAGALALVALTAACGSNDSPVVPETPAAAAKFPATVTAANGSVTIAKQPSRIVSLSSTATEMLFAIGAGAQVTAVDDQSNFPPEAPKTDLSAYKPNIEAIVGKTPDLVVLSDDMGSVVAGLGAAHVPALVLPAAKTLDDSYAQLRTLGAATGHPTEATKVADDIRTGVDKVVADAGADAKGLSFYHELDDTFYSAATNTFIGSLYAKLGMKNIADEAKDISTGYPQLSAEFIVQRDPNVVFLADTKCCKQTAATFGARPGFAKLSAVKTGNVVSLDDDVASRWGPRVVELVRTIAAAAGKAKASAAVKPAA